MGIRYSCDGCGAMLAPEAAPEQIGTVLKREYCDRCAPVAKKYMADVSEAHTAIAVIWRDKLAELRSRHTDAPGLDDLYLKLLPDAD